MGGGNSRDIVTYCPAWFEILGNLFGRSENTLHVTALLDSYVVHILRKLYLTPWYDAIELLAQDVKRFFKLKLEHLQQRSRAGQRLYYSAKSKSRH